jgi:DNA-binding transcriptional MerR regulator
MEIEGEAPGDSSSDDSAPDDTVVDSGHPPLLLDLPASPSPARARPSAKAATAFRTISEVSTDLEVPQHVLRFWETKFSQLRPLKRGGGRRYYRPEDVALLRRIHALLYREGYTIKGVQRVLRTSRNGETDAPEPAEAPRPATDARPTDSRPVVPAVTEPTIPGLPPKPSARGNDRLLRDLLAELKQLRALLD